MLLYILVIFPSIVSLLQHIYHFLFVLLLLVCINEQSLELYNCFSSMNESALHTEGKVDFLVFITRLN